MAAVFDIAACQGYAVACSILAPLSLRENGEIHLWSRSLVLRRIDVLHEEMDNVIAAWLSWLASRS